MPTDRELMAQAIVALEYHTDQTRPIQNTNLAIEALRARLAQPEPLPKKSKGALSHKENERHNKMIMDKVNDINARLYEQPEPAPVAWSDAPKLIYLQVCEDDVCEVPFNDHSEVSWCQDKINDSDIPYIRADTAPPQREWQGLTDEEVGMLTVFDGLHHVEVPILADFARAIEAKLKEKNA